MIRRFWIWFVLLTLTAGSSWAETPKVLFERGQIPRLRERVARPELAPIWARILKDAEAYCDPKSPRYADPADPYPLPEKGEYISQGRA